jgi:hypothetical protein
MISLLLSLALAAAAQTGDPIRHDAGSFSCEVPEGWDVVDLEEAGGPVTRLIGPDDPTGVYRAGISVRWHEPATPGFVPAKKALDDLRRKESASGRSSGGVRVLRIGGASFRTFEVTEDRMLPVDRLPASPRSLHHFIALVPWGQGYFVIRLSSTLETYLDHRDLFHRFLQRFRPR